MLPRDAALPPALPRHFPGRSLGDTWLESAKGKRPVPGPEVRRGRANLFDVLQMRPLLDGATTGQQLTGDAWLDAKGRRWAAGALLPLLSMHSC